MNTYTWKIVNEQEEVIGYVVSNSAYAKHLLFSDGISAVIASEYPSKPLSDYGEKTDYPPFDVQGLIERNKK